MRIFLGVAIGAAIGFLWGYFGKCSSGACLLTKNPWVSMIIGALFGLMFTVSK